MLDPLDARGLLRSRAIRPHKRLGQNFIVDPHALTRIIKAAELIPSQVVVEIGAGVGALTLALAGAGARVYAVEIDLRLIGILREIVAKEQRVVIVHADALELDLASLVEADDYSIVANIPYSITSGLIRRCLEAVVPPSSMVLTVQAEVAERIVADPGEMSLLALSVQIYGQPRIRARIPAQAFYPVPEVDSAVLRIDMHGTPAFDKELISHVFRLGRAGFSQRRKMLRNSLAPMLGDRTEAYLEAANIDPAARAQDLGLEDWSRLAREWTRA